ncbi:Gfo/Idh/MocA family oxidoreductase [Paenibacillus sp. CGMCC 1.16610]|uniref:Gfo/Idh/MocA family oxidoreductase n=1 Tax=Paenibacillus anseongense TaxID=2682845 RepID=A0ABW9U3Q7_9BACL|nr:MULTISPECIES: Gfo/Idh/MocA family oxidoreductase [Paenibacillus]MBA2940882.1 Gfo/Idh/MocA family oxidoreductase [Paenibacillus sp. CGMCC 1.16610]MVQ34066.1 gfo/Idh/MocA family oxidoreductase [Paenibacillus anseongense]
MDLLKIGMISFAHGHAFSYFNSLLELPEVKIVGIADEVTSRVEGIAQRHEVPYYADYRDLLAQDVDAVVICSENVHHAKLVIDAANAKKHVLCEKPLGTTKEEMEQMIAACKHNGVQLMTAFPCRYLAAVVRAKEAIERGEIGDIVAIKGTNHGGNPGGWFIDKSLSGGGAVLDHTVHVMDLMNWFLQSEVKEVYAYAATLFREELEVEDAGMLHIKFENGVFAVLDTSWSRPKSFPTWGDVTMEIVGTQGVITVDGFAQKNDLFSNAAGKGQYTFWGDNMDAFMIRDFVKALRQGEQVPVTGEDGLKAAQVALAAYESAKLGQPVAM